jgi:anti-sigma factor RsiW
MTKIFQSERKCPDEHLLAAYADQQLVGDERHEVEKHLVACDTCLHELGSLVRSQDTRTDRTPDDLLRLARGFAKPSTSGTSVWRWLPVPLLALLALIAFTTWRSTQVAPSNPTQNSPAPVQEAKSSSPELPNTSSDDSEIRGTGGAAAMIVSPTPGEHVSSAQPRFRWQAQPETESYEVQVMTEAGDLVWEAHTNSTSISLPHAIRLADGESYFLLVRAYKRHTGIVESAPVRFIAA